MWRFFGKLLRFWKDALRQAFSFGWAVFGIVTTATPYLIPVLFAITPSAKHLMVLEWAIHHPVRAHLLALLAAVIIYSIYAPYKLFEEIRSERDTLRDRIAGADVRILRTEVVRRPTSVIVRAIAENNGSGVMRRLIITAMRVNQSLDEPPINERFEHANDFAPSDSFPFEMELPVVDVLPQYIRFSYQFGESSKPHQYIFTWGGILNGNAAMELDHASVAQRDSVDEFLRRLEPVQVPHMGASLLSRAWSRCREICIRFFDY